MCRLADVDVAIVCNPPPPSLASVASVFVVVLLNMVVLWAVFVNVSLTNVTKHVNVLKW